MLVHNKNMQARKFSISRIIFNPKFLAFLGLLLIGLISFPVAKNFSQRYKANKEIEGLKAEIELIEGKNTKLKEFIDYLSSEQYAEEQARLSFGLKKQGEEAAVVEIDDSGAEPLNNNKIFDNIYNIPGLNEPEYIEPQNNSTRWYKYFFKKL